MTDTRFVKDPAAIFHATFEEKTIQVRLISSGATQSSSTSRCGGGGGQGKDGAEPQEVETGELLFDFLALFM